MVKAEGDKYEMAMRYSVNTGNISLPISNKLGKCAQINQVSVL